jgi:hypothetical protein
MDSDIWLPLVTLLAGWGLAQVTEVLKDRRAIDRERQARQAELQRATLLALQDALLEVNNLASNVGFALFVIALQDHREHPNPAAKRKAEEDQAEAMHRLREATGKAELLLSRVQDQQTRTEASLLVNSADMVGTLRRGNDG